MSNPRLTIAIPFYSRKDFLGEAIHSVLQQTISDWELIVCNDCSPEPGIAEYVASFEDERIRYHENPTNLGMAGNWNRCLELATTDLVTLLHADDRLLPEYIQLMATRALEFPDAVGLFCQATIIDGSGNPVFSFPDAIKHWLLPGGAATIHLRGKKALAALLRGNFIMCPTMCYRKALLVVHRFSSHWRFVLDLELFTRLLMEGQTLVGLPEIAYAYRRHGDNATVRYTDTLLRFREESDLYEYLSDEAQRLGWGEAARIARSKTMIQLNLMYSLLRDLASFRLKPAWWKTTFALQML